MSGSVLPAAVVAICVLSSAVPVEPSSSQADMLGSAKAIVGRAAELGRLGHRRTRAGRPDAAGVESLTERELEVARLIVDRRTNPQIAAALFRSQKTVESHVRNLFQKPGVSSRVEVERADRGSG